MDALAERIGRVRLGPLPLPYIFLLVLLPFCTLFSSHENSLLFSICVFVTVAVKGSLLSCWILRRATSWLLQGTFVSAVMVAQVMLLQYCLQSSLLPLILLVPPSTFTGICIFTFHLWDRREDKCEDPSPVLRSTQVIGIFSRGAPEEYAWLTAMMERVGRAVSFCITNLNSRQFEQQVSRCSFAILYHSKTRGRVNITNVTDSLYDHELEHMSQVLGKSNVIVVADDMDDSSSGTENNILERQPAIAQLSRGLYLFTAKDKMDGRLMKAKVQPIYDIISRGSVTDATCDLVSLLLVIAPWICFLCSTFPVFFLITTNLSGSVLVCYAISAPYSRGALLPFSHPVQKPRNAARSRGRQGACRVGLAVVLVLVVVELSSLYWAAVSMKTVLLIVQSVGTGALTLRMSVC